MIFSMGENQSSLEVHDQNNFDIICLFQLNNSIKAPLDSWFNIVCASLRNKQNVLILEPEITSWPSPKANFRWQMGEGWICLEPRALSTISAAYPKHSQNIVLFRQFLSSI